MRTKLHDPSLQEFIVLAIMRERPERIVMYGPFDKARAQESVDRWKENPEVMAKMASIDEIWFKLAK